MNKFNIFVRDKAYNKKIKQHDQISKLDCPPIRVSNRDGENKKSEAINVYSEVNKCRFCDNYIKELAGLLMVRTLMTEEEALTKIDLSEKILAVENNSKILRYYIAEQRGYLEMNKNNL